MGVIIMYLVGLLILGLSVLSYFVLKHYGYKKTGIAVSLFFALIVLIPVFTGIFESELYFKSDAIDDLKVANIILKDDFEIEYSDISGMPDYYQKTRLKISDKDRDIIINQIKSNENFAVADIEGYYNMTIHDESDKLIWNYNVKNKYITETYEKALGYSPIKISITVEKGSNILSLTKIMD